MENTTKLETNTDFALSESVHSEHKIKYHNVILTLLSLLVVPVYLYGLRVLVLLAAALLTAIILDFFCISVFLRSKRLKHDYSGVVTALVTVMLMPATVPVWVVIVSVAIGLCIAKYPFGGEGKNIFNPAAVGIAFSALCWPEYVLQYPVPFTTYSLTDSSGILFGSSPSSILSVGGTPKIEYFNVLLGNFSGPLGATSMAVLIGCMIYLIARKVVSKRIVFSAFAVVALFAVIFPRVSTGVVSSLVYEFSSGALVFGIIFMAGDPVTTPFTKNGRIFYGILVGILIMMFRYFGKVELGFVYAILLANVFAGSCDMYADFLSRKLRFMDKKAPVFGKKNQTDAPDVLERVGEIDG